MKKKDRAERRATLYGIGVGPGDPELMTLKAVRIVQKTRNIIIPEDETGYRRAAQIVASWLHPKRIEIALPLPCRAADAGRKAVYGAAAEAVRAILRAGDDVAMLCEGDPMLYGSFLGLLEAISGDAPEGESFAIEVIPGISSVAAATAAVQIGAARGRQSFAVIPATLSDAHIRRCLAGADGAALIKLGRHLGRVRELLNRMGRGADALYISNISTEQASILPLARISGDQSPYFSLILLPPGKADKDDADRDDEAAVTMDLSAANA